MVMSDRDELDEIRKKRLSEIQKQVEVQKQQETMQQQVDAQRQMILQQILEPAARERLATIKLARKDLATNVEDNACDE